MSRYVFTYTIDNEVVHYYESTPEEERLDCTDDGIAVEFTGNGYLKFWHRCMEAVANDRNLLVRTKNGWKPKSGTWCVADNWYDDEIMSHIA